MKTLGKVVIAILVVCLSAVILFFIICGRTRA
jgi:hypothetical protein